MITVKQFGASQPIQTRSGNTASLLDLELHLAPPQLLSNYKKRLVKSVMKMTAQITEEHK